jgi:putative hydrolase of the HAD superfamily
VARPVSRRLEAVVFDLFGTLVSEFPTKEWGEQFGALASALGVDAAAMRREWEESAIDRQTGRLGDIGDNLRTIARRAGGDPSERQLEDAVAIRAALYDRFFRPLPGALETVRWVREAGYRSALVSMCAPDTPPLWHGSAFDGLIQVEVFSSEIGLRKPDPGIYLAATQRLGVEPSSCLYVGDGSYGELRGATEIGMRAVLLRDPDEVEGSMLRPGLEPWDGATIDSIGELPAFIQGIEASVADPA